MKIFLSILFLAILAIPVKSQGLKGLLNKAKEAVSGNNGSSLGSDEIAAGLKEALVKGVDNGTNLLSKADGFFANAALKILLPPEAQKVENTLRNIGMDKQVDEAILSMNRAAEDACKSAAPIFSSAIKNMSFADALGILKGGDTAATGYLRGKTSIELTNAFSPVIEQSLKKVDATKYWNTIISAYNKIPFQQKVNPDLVSYVTEKALDGIFYQIAIEEKSIRKDPVARTSELLKKVFSK